MTQMMHTFGCRFRFCAAVLAVLLALSSPAQSQEAPSAGAAPTQPAPPEPPAMPQLPTPEPGLSVPGLASPGLASPGLASPGLASPGLASPGLSLPGGGSVDPEASLPGLPAASVLPPVSPSSQSPSLVAPLMGAAAPPGPAPTASSPLPVPHAGAGAAAAMAPDLSPLGMFRAAHWVVKGVMILLGLACFLTWTVLFFKLVEFFVAGRRVLHSAAVIRDGAELSAVADALHGRADPAAFMAQAALEEMRRSDAALAAAGTDGVKERVGSILERVEVQSAKRLRRGTGMLATIGSTAPFVGLFGTVWGIMNAFISISQSKTTNLAVVAPGIAEALLATAIGLVAAIPAVVIYNHCARKIASYRVTLGDAGAGVARLVSRDLDFRRLTEAAAPAHPARVAVARAVQGNKAGAPPGGFADAAARG